MTRHDTRLSIVVAPAIATGIVVASAVIIASLVYPAYGQECRYMRDCEFVPVASASKPAGKAYRVRRHYRTKHFAKSAKKSDTLTAADRKLSLPTIIFASSNEDEKIIMPLVWPVLDEQPSSRGEENAHQAEQSAARITTGHLQAVGAVAVASDPRETVPWRHTETGKRSIVAAFAILVAATAAAIILSLYGEKNERANPTRRTPNRHPDYARFFRRNGPKAWRTRAAEPHRRAA